jgi:hypothetical protein
MMDEAKQPEPIESEPKESAASRIERREAEIAIAMKREAERRAAVIENMHRLRALRLSQTSKASELDLPRAKKSISKKTAKSFSARLVGSVARGSSANGSAHLIDQGARRIG